MSMPFYGRYKVTEHPELLKPIQRQLPENQER